MGQCLSLNRALCFSLCVCVCVCFRFGGADCCCCCCICCLRYIGGSLSCWFLPSLPVFGFVVPFIPFRVLSISSVIETKVWLPAVSPSGVVLQPGSFLHSPFRFDFVCFVSVLPSFLSVRCYRRRLHVYLRWHLHCCVCLVVVWSS